MANVVAANAEELEHDAGAPVDGDQGDDNDISDDYVDPRVQVELEKLNSATDAINKLEVELDEARALFRQRLSESSHRIKSLAKKLGNCIEKARPYYEARVKAKEAHAETQKAALRFERANSAHAAAKEMVFLAEEGLQKEGRTFDPAWQEMLNHATMRVNEAERERTFSEQEHKQTSQTYNEAEQKVQYLQKELKRAISKSRPYFEMKAQFFEVMEEQKQQVHQLEEQIFYVKQSYAFALRNLEQISDEIHQRRQLKRHHQTLGSRGPGVGAESPVPPLPEKDANLADVGRGTTVDDVYLTLPQKSGCATAGTVLQTVVNASSAGPEDVKKKVVDHGSQTDIDGAQACPLRHKRDTTPDERISAWVQETGLRSQPAPRKASLLGNGPQGLAAMFLNIHEDSDMSDAESLNSTDVLTDEQIANLMLDKDLDEAYQDILVSPRTKESNGTGGLKAPVSLLDSILNFRSNAEELAVVKETTGSADKDLKHPESHESAPARGTDVGTEMASPGSAEGHRAQTSQGTQSCERRIPAESNGTREAKASDCDSGNVKLRETVESQALRRQGHVFAVNDQSPNKAMQNMPQAAASQIKDKLVPSSDATGCAAGPSEGDQQEIQVVAVQFTVQETHVLPKTVARSVPQKESSPSTGSCSSNAERTDGSAKRPLNRSASAKSGSVPCPGATK